MNPLLHWLTSPEWSQVVKTLLHSLWQGALIAAALVLLLRRLANPRARYRCSLVALATIPVAGIITWAILNASNHHPPPAPLPVASETATSPDLVSPNQNPITKVVVFANHRTPAPPQTHWTAWLALAWLVGAIAMLGRAGVKVAGAERLRRACRPLDNPQIAQLVTETQRAVGLSRQIRVTVTDRLTSPAVVGVLVPTLVLPLTLLTTLTPEQIRFILLHELAHIRRGDYFANLFQLFTEALLFFNPAVWWISHQVRREREACCDALAIELSGAPADYARTLVYVTENMLGLTPDSAPAFGGEPGPSSLSDRVQRLLVPGYRPALRLTWRAMIAALVLGTTLLVLSAQGTRIVFTELAGPLGAATTETQLGPNQPGVPDETNFSPTPANLPTYSSSNLPPNLEFSGLNKNSHVEYNVADGKTSVTNGGLVRFSDTTIRADSIQLDQKTGNLVATGNAQKEGPGFNNKTTRTELNIRSNQPAIEPSAGPTNLIHTSEKRRALLNKLNQIQLDRVYFNATPLSSVIGHLQWESWRRDPDGLGDGLGINFVFDYDLKSKVFKPTDDPFDLLNTRVTINPPLTNVSVLDALQAIVKGAAKPIRFGIDENAVVISAGKGIAPLFTREYKVSPAFFDQLREAGYSIDLAASTNRETNSESIRRFFTDSGVDLRPAEGESVFCNHILGVLLVRATSEELDQVERLLQSLQSQASQTSSGTSVQTNSPSLLIRTYLVDPIMIRQGMESAIPGSIAKTNVQEAVRTFLATSGVDLNPPKSVLFNDRKGELVVQANQEELDVIESVLQALNRPIPQVNIKARFVEIDSANVNGFDLFLGNIPLAQIPTSKATETTSPKAGPSRSSAGNIPSQLTGILTDPQYRLLLRALENKKGMDILAVQEVTTLSGRQAQIQTVEMKTIVNGVNLPTVGTGPKLPNNDPTNSLYQTQVLPFGPVLDVIPTVSSDGYTIQLTIIPTVTEFLGYDDPGKALPKLQAGSNDGFVLPLPRMRLRQVTTNAVVWDGQTLVLGVANDQIITKQTDGGFLEKKNPDVKKKQLLVFITATIVDPAGNRGNRPAPSQQQRW